MMQVQMWLNLRTGMAKKLSLKFVSADVKTMSDNFVW